jgi:hypothetical protein
MRFYTIQSREFGRVCGYKRKWMDLWLKRPRFRWDTFPQPGEGLVFYYEEAARKFLLMHGDTLPADCEIKFNDTGPRDGAVT